MAAPNPFTENDVAGKYFVGRDLETRKIQGFLDQVTDGASVGGVISGAHGRGKSSLLQRFGRLAKAQNLVVAISQCDEGQLARSHVDTFLKKTCEAVDDFSEISTYTDDWDKGTTAEIMQTPRRAELRTDDLAGDLNLLLNHLRASGAVGLIIALDEAQALDPSVLSQLRNASKELAHFGVILCYRLEELAADAGRISELTRDWLSGEAIAADRDMGTAAFFNQIVAVGPFDSRETAEHCITRRLRETDITFDGPAIHAVAEISGLIPRYIIQFCHSIYEHCAHNGMTNATIETVDKAFESHHRETLREVETSLSVVPDSQFAFLDALVRENGFATVETIATEVFGSGTEEPNRAMVHGFVTEFFETLSCDGIRIQDGHMTILHPRIRHAIRIHLLRTRNGV